MTTIHRLAALFAMVLALGALPARAQDDHAGHDHSGQDHSGHDHAQPAPVVVAPSDVAPPATPAGARLEWLMKGFESAEPMTIDGVFTAEFLEAVPAEQLTQVLNNFRVGAQGFALRRINESGPNRLVAVAQAKSDGSLWRLVVGTQPDEPHLVDTLFFQPAPDEAMGPLEQWSQADAVLNELAPQNALVIYRVKPDGDLAKIHEHNADKRLAIGSTFKLWILGALAQSIQGGEHRWDEMLMIDDAHRSLPSGVMQDLAHGTEKPIEEFARQMISISDNTATDHLLALVGRERVEDFMRGTVAAPERNLPFLSTREIFAIKLSEDPTLMQRYADADVETRRKILAEEVAGKTPNIMMAGAWRAPRVIEQVEWFATGPELCRLMHKLWTMADEDGLAELRGVLGVNNGLGLSDQTWTRTMFKGGSEPGVMSLTWLLQRAPQPGETEGPVFAVSMTLNNPAAPLDEMRVVGLAQKVMERLEKEP